MSFICISKTENKFRVAVTLIYYLIRVGNHIVTAGINVTNINTITEISNIGISARNVLTKLASAIWFVINKQMPTGGVTKPIHKLTLMIIPNCNGSIPNAESKGIKIGVIMIIAALASINIPIMKNIIFNSNKITILLDVKALNVVNTCCGKPDVVIT